MATDAARLDLADVHVVDSGAVLAQLDDDAEFSGARIELDRSGIEAAFGAFAMSDAAEGLVELRDTTVRDAPAAGMELVGLANAVLDSVTIDGAGTIATWPAMMMRDSDSVRLTNSTVSDNHGAGLVAMDSSVRIESTTIADNALGQFAPVRSSLGGIAAVHFRSSIVSGQAALVAPVDESDESELDLSGLTSEYTLWNGVDDGLGALLPTLGTGNLIDVDPRLEPLADNGGATLTRMPAAGSPVIDAGDPDPVGAPALDQRGAARIDGVIDMGSVEAGTLVEPGPTEPGATEPGETDPGATEPGATEPTGAEPGAVGTAEPPAGDDHRGPGSGTADATTSPDAAPQRDLPTTGAGGIAGPLLGAIAAVLAGLALLGRRRLSPARRR